MKLFGLSFTQENFLGYDIRDLVDKVLIPVAWVVSVLLVAYGIMGLFGFFDSDLDSSNLIYVEVESQTDLAGSRIVGNNEFGPFDSPEPYCFNNDFVVWNNTAYFAKSSGTTFGEAEVYFQVHLWDEYQYRPDDVVGIGYQQVEKNGHVISNEDYFLILDGQLCSPSFP